MITLDCPIRTQYGKIYTPNEKQCLFHASPSKYRLFVGGLGAGKTTAGAVEMVLTALRYPGSRHLIARNSMGDLKETTWNVFRAILDGLHPCLVVSETESLTSLSVNLCNGSEILGMHLQKDSKYGGLDLSTAWIDECCENANAEAYNMLARRVGRWRIGHPDEPPGGRLWMSGTPNGRDWVHNKFVVNPSDRHYFIISPTKDNLEYLPDHYVEDAIRDYGREKAEMMLGATWDSWELRVYPDFNPRHHVIDRRHKVWRALPKEWPRYCALDPGIASTHPAAAVFVAVDHDGNRWVYDCWRESNLVVDQQARRLLGHQDYDALKWLLVDPSSRNRNDQTGDSRLEAYRAAGLTKIRPADNDLTNGIARINNLLFIDPEHEHPLTRQKGSPKLFIKSDLTDLIEEFEDYRYEKTGALGLKDPKPVGRKNDLLDALRYLCNGQPASAVEKVTPLDDFWADVLNVREPNHRNPAHFIGNERALRRSRR